MTSHEPLTGLESLEDVLDDIVPTQRRPQGVGQGKTLIPPPCRVGENEDHRVDMKAILSEPPRLSEVAIDPWPLFPEPIALRQEQDWLPDPTPLPTASDLGSVAPLALSEAPPPSGSAPSHRPWQVATVALAASMIVGVVILVSPWNRTEGSSETLAAAAVSPPIVSVHELPVVHIDLEPTVVVIDEEPDIIWEPMVDAPSRSHEERPDHKPTSGSDTQPKQVIASASEETSAREKDGEETAENSSTLSPFDPAAADAALNNMASSATSCREEGSPAGTPRVSVTFAPTGRVTTAMVSGAFAGTPVGGCIARTFRGARIEPFDGGLVTVHKTIAIR